MVDCIIGYVPESTDIDGDENDNTDDDVNIINLVGSDRVVNSTLDNLPAQYEPEILPLTSSAMSSLNIKYICTIFDSVKKGYNNSYSRDKNNRIAELVLLLEMEAKSKSTNTIQSGIKKQSINVPQERDSSCLLKKEDYGKYLKMSMI